VLPNTIVELSLWSVLRSVHPSIVEASVGAGDLAVLPVGVVGIVGHPPAGNTASNVGKLRFLSALQSSEGSSTLTVGLSLLSLQTDPVVPTKAIAGIAAGVWSGPVPDEAELALTGEVVGFLEETDGVLVTELLLAHLVQAPVSALSLAGGSLGRSAGVGWTVDTEGLLLAGLVGSHLA